MAKASAGPIIEGVSGKFSGLIVQNSKSGLVIKRQARYKKHQNPAQTAVAARLRAAAEVWGGMTFEQVEVWDAYAQTIESHNPLTGQPYHPSGYNAFLALATKVLQADPFGTVPVEPPAGVYSGDSMIFSVSADLDSHTLTFTASAANSGATVTELLLEKLPNERRKSTGRMTSAGFHQFSSGQPDWTIELDPGTYVAGYRFVEKATGRQTLAQVVARVQV